MSISLHIIGSRQLGGAERFHMRLVRALNKRGHTAISVNRPNSPVHIALEGKVRQAQIPMRNGWDVFSSMNIRRLIRESRASIVQTYLGRASRLMRYSRYHDAIHVARLGGYYKINGYYEHAHAWVGNTHGICEYLVNNGLPAQRVYLIGNFVSICPPTPDRTLIPLRRSLGIPLDAIILFSLGRFVRRKGIDDLLTAFAQIQPEFHERPIYLAIAGDGPLNEKLQRYGEELGVHRRLRWLGWQKDPGYYYDMADLFVCPSRQEPLGNVILEAWAHQLPVISSRTLGAVELIQDRVNGVLVPANSPRGLARGLLEVLKAGDRAWNCLAGEGMQTLRANHSEEVVVDAYLTMYHELMSKDC